MARAVAAFAASHFGVMLLALSSDGCSRILADPAYLRYAIPFMSPYWAGTEEGIVMAVCIGATLGAGVAFLVTQAWDPMKLDGRAVMPGVIAGVLSTVLVVLHEALSMAGPVRGADRWALGAWFGGVSAGVFSSSVVAGTLAGVRRIRNGKSATL